FFGMSPLPWTSASRSLIGFDAPTAPTVRNIVTAVAMSDHPKATSAPDRVRLRCVPRSPATTAWIVPGPGRPRISCYFAGRFRVTSPEVFLVFPVPSCAVAVATVDTDLWFATRFLPNFESGTGTFTLFPVAIEKLALPSVTIFFLPLEVITLCAVLSTSVPLQWPFAFAGHFTRTGALPFFTVTVCVGIRTPVNGEVVVGHGAALVPAWFVAFGVGAAIWTELSLWRCADIPFAGTAPWNDPV